MNIQPKHPSEAIQILGVWFNMNNNKHFNIGQAKEIVHNISYVIKNKKITDKHMSYIFNNVIIPRIEYHTQISVLNEQQLTSTNKKNF